MVKIIFQGTFESDTFDRQMTLHCNSNNEIYIEIQNTYICLDKSTAIRLHRELKKQISFINDIKD
jgi:hypothetical protein